MVVKTYASELAVDDQANSMEAGILGQLYFTD